MENFKKLGNKSFNNKNYDKALEYYKQGLELDDTNFILYSNCSAAYLKLNDIKNALKYSIKCTKLNPEWSKGWNRLGTSLMLNNKNDKALIAYKRALELESDNKHSKEMILKLKKLQNINNIDTESDSEIEIDYNTKQSNNFDMNKLFQNMLSNPKMFNKIQNPEFQKKILLNKNNPLGMMNDPEMIELMQEFMKNL